MLAEGDNDLGQRESRVQGQSRVKTACVVPINQIVGVGSKFAGVEARAAAKIAVQLTAG